MRSRTIQRAFDRRAALLGGNLRYPSLHTKKYNEANDIWQGRVTRDWRFYCRIVDNLYDLIDIIPHPQ
jgi:hypothetical protein